MKDAFFGIRRFAKFGIVLGTLFIGSEAFASPPTVISVVQQSPAAGDASEILGVLSRLFTVHFGSDVHDCTAHVELYEPGSKIPEILCTAGLGGISGSKAHTWAQISVQWADCAYLPLADVGKDSEVVNLKINWDGSGADSHGIVKKSDVDIDQGSSWSNFTAFPSTSSHIPIGIEMVTPDGVPKEMLTTLDETLAANPKAWIVVYTLDLK
jgi:hypothetical protein